MASKKKPAIPVAGAKDSKRTRDSFANFQAALGLQANSLSSGAGYAFNFLTKNRLLLEAMYRESWICGAAVDVIADDMTQAGIEIDSTNMKPDAIDKLQESMADMSIWQSLTSVLKWSRLYGSCCGFLLIEGQDPSTPLRIETVGRGQFKGILPMDRWQLLPSISQLIKEYGPQMGLPKFYTSVPDAILPMIGKIHHSRMLRFDGIELPHYQKTIDNLWGESVLERIYDRLVAFDSATTGAAQLIYRAYLRTIKIDGLREIISSGGPAYEGLIKNIEMIRRFQSSEGLTLLDKEDEFQTSSYTFAGLDEMLMEFGHQLCGALEIPYDRLFGESPGGLNSTGDNQLRIYYDGIRKKQKTRLYSPVKKVLEIMSMSLLGKTLPEGFSFTFNPLWQLTESAKSEIASKDTTTISDAFASGLVSKPTALRELRTSARTTGMWANVTDEEIEDAENEPPPAPLPVEGDIDDPASESNPGD